MKTLIMVVLFLFLSIGNSFAIHSKVIIGKVQNEICGEMDPFIFGDICLITLEKIKGEEITLIFDYDDFLDKFELNSLKDRTICLRREYLRPAVKKNELEILKPGQNQKYYWAPIWEVKVIRKSELDRDNCL